MGTICEQLPCRLISREYQTSVAKKKCWPILDTFIFKMLLTLSVKSCCDSNFFGSFCPQFLCFKYNMIYWAEDSHAYFTLLQIKPSFYCFRFFEEMAFRKGPSVIKLVSGGTPKIFSVALLSNLLHIFLFWNKPIVQILSLRIRMRQWCSITTSCEPWASKEGWALPDHKACMGGN